jgi:hypothetical protein
MELLEGKMKIYYFNDKKEPVIVRVVHQDRPSEINPSGTLNINYYQLSPQEGKLFDVDAPDNTIPFLKTWDRQVLLSYIQEANLPSQRDDENKG